MVTRSGEVPQGSGAGISSTIYTDKVSKLLKEGKLAGLGMRIVVENTRVSYSVSTITVSRREKKFNTDNMKELLKALSESNGHPYLSASMELTTARPRRFSPRRLPEKLVAMRQNTWASLDVALLAVPLYPVVRAPLIAIKSLAEGTDKNEIWKELGKNLAWGASEMIPVIGWGFTAAHANYLTEAMGINRIPQSIELQVSKRRGILGRRIGYQTVARFDIPQELKEFNMPQFADLPKAA